MYVLNVIKHVRCIPSLLTFWAATVCEDSVVIH